VATSGPIPSPGMSVMVWAMSAWQSTIGPSLVEAIKIPANGLEHRALVWGAGARTVVLVHGYMDAAGTWDRVAPALAATGRRVVALDMRGFGDGARASRGSYYHFADYVFDLADVVDALSPDDPVELVGHSMGGTVATLFAGSYPERVARLANLEGLGPPDTPPEIGADRMRHWIDQVRRVRAKEREGRAPTFTREEALRRLAGNHPSVPPDVLAHRLTHLVREESDDRVSWLVDPLHRTTSPVPFFAPLWMAFAKKITCPVLFVHGGPNGFHPPDEEERLACFANLERAEIEGAGHMMHWTRPDEVAALLRDFLGA
jgi:pimeloyl-ACP methyl ester carboxylesterase